MRNLGRQRLGGRLQGNGGAEAVNFEAVVIICWLETFSFYEIGNGNLLTAQLQHRESEASPSKGTR